MTKTIATLCLSGVAALAIAVVLPGMQSFGAAGFSPAAAFARGGSDNSGSGNSGHGGHDDSSGSGHSGHDDSSSGSSDDSGSHASDDNGGHGADDGAGDDRGGRRGRDDAASTTTTATKDDNGTRRHDRDQARNRPEATLTVSSTQLQGLLDGSLVAVDQLGRRLEVEVELEHGVRTVKAQVHRSDAVSKPGKITTVSINSASAP